MVHFRAAHARGLRVIGDLTTNHSGVTHEWFAAAAADPDAPERAFYYFRPDGSHLGWYDVPSLPKFRFGPDLIGRLAARPAAEREASAVILLGRVAPGLLSDLESLLQTQALMLLGRLQTPVSAVLMRGLLDRYLQTAAQPAGA